MVLQTTCAFWPCMSVLVCCYVLLLKPMSALIRKMYMQPWLQARGVLHGTGVLHAVRSVTTQLMTHWVACAGNNQKDACGTSPANVDVVLAVAASDVANKFSPGQQQRDILYSWDNTGPCVDLFAPGATSGLEPCKSSCHAMNSGA